MGKHTQVRTVLVVDDDPFVLSGFQAAFLRAGKRVFTTTTAATARGIAIHERPDFALIDLFLGGDWGIDLIEQLRGDAPDTELGLMSGYLGVASAATALRLGARHVFFKPVSGKAVLNQVERGIHIFDQNKKSGYPTLARVEWEHIMRVLADCKGVISEAARRLGIRRQSLQQRLKKPIPPD